MKSALKNLCFLSIIIIVIAAAIVSQTMLQKEFGNSVIRTSMQNTDLVLIIDAGHGGEDGGAVSISGVKESEINLGIASDLDQIMGFFGVQTIMTRNTENLDYTKKADTIREKKAEDQNNRLRLINSTENAVMISIHQNKFPDSGPFGSQVLFAPTNGSKVFAEYMQKLLISSLNSKNRRSATKVPSNILLMNHVKCPAILIECGFLSNTVEERLLLTDTYRLKVAAVIAAGYLNNQDSLLDIISGGTHEG